MYGVMDIEAIYSIHEVNHKTKTAGTMYYF